MNEKIIKFHDLQVCTEYFGIENNPTILLIAGATVSMLFWDAEFCKRLSEKGYFVIRYDNRDVGKSTFYEPSEAPYNIIDLTEDAISILDGYNIEKCHLVGLSLGGLIAQIAAIKHPTRINSLTLMSTGPWGDSEPDIPEMDSRILDFHAQRDKVDWKDEEEVVNYLIQGSELMAGRKRFYKQKHEKLIRSEFNRAGNFISMFNHATLGGGEEYWNKIHEIKQPTLIIHGTDDRIWHYKNALLLMKNIRNTSLVTLERTGHELNFEDWDTIIKNIDSHIKNIGY